MIKIIIVLSSITVTLCGVIWRNLNAKISDNSKKIAELPHVILLQDMAKVKTDLEWIKRTLQVKL